MEPGRSVSRLPGVVATRPGDASTIYIAQRGGKLQAVRDGQLAAQPVLDITKMISSGEFIGILAPHLLS